MHQKVREDFFVLTICKFSAGFFCLFVIVNGFFSFIDSKSQKKW